VDLERLDHVALWVSDRDTIATFAERHLGMHVIERTDRFTLVGPHARHGKLTLFEAEPGRESGALAEVGLRVNRLEDALAALPNGSRDEVEVADGLRIRLVEAPTEVEYDLHHVALRTADPERSAAQWQALGLEPVDSHAGARRLEVAGSFLELWREPPGQPERPLLNHLGVLVDSADAWRERAEQAGAEVVDVVDAPNTYAVFVLGPEQVKLEYVEHKPSFALE
jgi:catechol 2,3-dioxygenase-like lactoylglutathione lyase family enzyme